MIKFTLEKPKDSQPIVASVSIEGEGDVTLFLNDIAVLCICATDGILKRRYVDQASQQKSLEAAGIKFTKDNLIMRYGDGN